MLTATITPEQQQAIAAFLDGRTIVSGLGSDEAACSVASINLALTGRLTDEIPDCMSRVIGLWIIQVQDSMPDEMRNSDEWRRLLPLAAGTGRKHELERQELVLDWMWGALSTLQPLVDQQGFGDPWRQMCELRTAEAARRARQAAYDAAAEVAHLAADAASDAAAVGRACHIVNVVADAASAAVAAYCACDIADSAYRAADAAAFTVVDDDGNTWQQMNPIGLLERLVAVSEP